MSKFNFFKKFKEFCIIAALLLPLITAFHAASVMYVKYALQDKFVTQETYATDKSSTGQTLSRIEGDVKECKGDIKDLLKRFPSAFPVYKSYSYLDYGRPETQSRYGTDGESARAASGNSSQ